MFQEPPSPSVICWAFSRWTKLKQIPWSLWLISKEHSRFRWNYRWNGRLAKSCRLNWELIHHLERRQKQKSTFLYCCQGNHPDDSMKFFRIGSDFSKYRPENTSYKIKVRCAIQLCPFPRSRFCCSLSFEACQIPQRPLAILIKTLCWFNPLN